METLIKPTRIITPMKKDISKIINYALLGLGLIVLIIFINTIDLTNIQKSISLAGPRVIFFVFILMLINVFVKAYRWKLLTFKTTGKEISLWFSFLSIFAGVASGSIFPGRNEITKPLMLKSIYKARLSNSIPAAFIEKIFDLLGVVFFGFIVNS